MFASQIGYRAEISVIDRTLSPGVVRCAAMLVAAGRWYVRQGPGTVGKRRLSRRVDRALQLADHRFVTTTRSDTRLAGTTTDLIQRYLYLFGVWEPNLTAWITRRLAPGDVFVDVGANIGHFSLLASRLVQPGGAVVAIEPSPSILAMLGDNLARNPRSSAIIRTVDTAAADAARSLPIWRADAANIGATTTVFSPGLEWEAQVEARPLTEILTADEQRRTRIIKIDVEGFEAPVVRGLLGMLPEIAPPSDPRRGPPLFSAPSPRIAEVTVPRSVGAGGRDDLEIVVEVNGSRTPPGEDAQEIVDSLAARGFHAYALENDYEPESYVSRRPPAAPQRLDPDRPLANQPTDLVFSRIDADRLTNPDERHRRGSEGPTARVRR